jgi:hypothetical protein
MRPVALGLLCLALAASTHASADAADDWKVVEAQNRAAQEKFREQLPTLKTSRLFRIDPSASRRGAPSQSPRFHDWVVVASAAPSDTNSEATISRSLAAIVSSHDDGVAACFDPHHGLTLTNGKESVDVLLCFECSRYIVFTPDGTVVFAASFATRREKETWGQVFRTAGLSDSARK